MHPINLAEEVSEYVENHIGSFHTRRLAKLANLRLKAVLKRKNPYLFRAKDLTPEGLVQQLLEAHLSSQEETLFGEFLEGLAIFVCSRTVGGRKSAVPGIDIEFEREGILYLVAVKSGPNWANSRQLEKLRDDFKRAKRIHRTNNPHSQVVAINGCCYGRDEQPDKGDYYKYCGQQFWTFITGQDDFYLKIIEPLGYRAKEKNQQFLEAFARVRDQFVEELLRDFCNGYRINWARLVQYNSAANG
ncbi:MAG: PmeII family type II restriction endonuclease [Anaerolineae bacterium]|nr:PmeII family type II restriction endonuclease [Thermoflexales bacterium]MDW8407632.1 PmeII family type II restriction endonuclease [Anaerolineae bacterium]